MRVIWTKHAEERQKEWEKKLMITKKEVDDLMVNPDQILPGDKDAFIAQRKFRSGLLQVPFVDVERKRKILTIYWTSNVEKYWGEEKE